MSLNCQSKAHGREEAGQGFSCGKGLSHPGCRRGTARRILLFSPARVPSIDTDDSLRSATPLSDNDTNAGVQVASDLFTIFHVDTPDGERLSQETCVQCS